MRSVTVLLCFGLICGCRATNSDGILYPFGINSVLRCHVPNPFAGNPGEPDTVEEVAPRIAFVPGVNGSVYLPRESGFRMPSLKLLDKDTLLEFLGLDLNSQLSATTRPTTPAPRACNLLATVVGSGGQLLTFQADNYTGPTVDIEVITNKTTCSLLNFNQVFSPLQYGNCTVINEWTLLPTSFYPRWYASGRCSGRNCTAPIWSQTCEPDIRPDRVAYITVLRWDCCWNYLNKIWRWDCGWRKVSSSCLISGPQPILDPVWSVGMTDETKKSAKYHQILSLMLGHGI